MLFVSNFNGYQVLVRNERVKLIPDPRGADYGMTRDVLVPQIMIEFKSPGHLTYTQRQQALEFFDRRDTGEDQMPPGPYRIGGMASDPDFEGMMYNGSDHWLMFSVFNTETDCPLVEDLEPSEVRELVEKTLLACQQLGQDYILIEQQKAPAPWETYEETHHKQIAAAVKLLKLDPRVVIAYEQERENPRPGVIADLEALITETADEQKALDDLTVHG